jgi:hypothetical protein
MMVWMYRTVLGESPSFRSGLGRVLGITSEHCRYRVAGNVVDIERGLRVEHVGDLLAGPRHSLTSLRCAAVNRLVAEPPTAWRPEPPAPSRAGCGRAG